MKLFLRCHKFHIIPFFFPLTLYFSLLSPPQDFVVMLESTLRTTLYHSTLQPKYVHKVKFMIILYYL